MEDRPSLPIPSALAAAVARDPRGGRQEWLDSLPAVVAEAAGRWGLTLDAPYEPGGQTAWVAPATDDAGQPLVLKVGWRHTEALHEAAGLRLWDGDPTVVLHHEAEVGASNVLLLERCSPGTPLSARPGAEQDEVVADLLRRLWRPAPPGALRPLAELGNQWADESERDLDLSAAAIDPGPYRDGISLFRSLADEEVAEPVMLATDLHAGNVLAAVRDQWLAIDPKPYVGDRHYDVLQHLLNRTADAEEDPLTLTRRMADLLDLDAERLSMWFFARCCVETAWDPATARTIHRLATR